METAGVLPFFKKFLKIVSIALLGWTAAFAQTIRIADNNPLHPTGANIYITIQAAVNAAAPGDLVYVQPSLTSYGDVTVDRPITLRGIGFNTGKDLAYQSIVNNIALTNTVTNSTNASGTTIEGISANAVFLGNQTGSFTFTLQNITISNCNINYIDRNSSCVLATNVIIKNNSLGVINFQGGSTSQFLIYGNRFFGPAFVASYSVNVPSVSGNPFACCPNSSGSFSSYVVSNNIFSIGSYIDFGLPNPLNVISSFLVTNNVFLGNPATPNYFAGAITDATVSNNIFYGTTPGSSSSSFTRNIYSNNLSFNTTNNTLPPPGTGAGNTGAGNLVNVDPKFTNVPVNSNWASTLDFTLQPGSPAKSAGSDGTDIGLTGGAYPIAAGNFNLVPTSLPIIITFNPAGMVPQNQPIQTNIKAKSN